MGCLSLEAGIDIDAEGRDWMSTCLANRVDIEMGVLVTMDRRISHVIMVSRGGLDLPADHHPVTQVKRLARHWRRTGRFNQRRLLHRGSSIPVRSVDMHPVMMANTKTTTKRVKLRKLDKAHILELYLLTMREDATDYD